MRLLVGLLMLVACQLHAATDSKHIVATYCDEFEKECIVCFEDLDMQEVQILQCEPEKKHAFHKKCLDEWWKTEKAKGNQQSCPMCRRVYIDYTTQGTRIQQPDFTSLTHFVRTIFCTCW